MKMFQKIQELIDDSEALVCVLIDEVSFCEVLAYRIGFNLEC